MKRKLVEDGLEVLLAFYRTDFIESMFDMAVMLAGTIYISGGHYVNNSPLHSLWQAHHPSLVSFCYPLRAFVTCQSFLQV